MPQIILMLILFLLLPACATQQSKYPQQALGNAEQPYPPERPPQVGDILHVPTGIYVNQETLFDHAKRARIIYVGETHDNPASHRTQLDVLRALAAENPNRVSLGMEMFTPQQQTILDQWSAGVLTEKEFLKAVDWANTWGMNFAYYRDLLTFCKKHRIKVLGLNTDTRTRMKVTRHPIESLESDLQEQLPEMDTSDPYHHAMLESVFRDHKMGQNMFEGFKRVQTLWDETMAANAARYLERVSEDHQLVIIAGSKHISYGYGIPRRLFRRLPASYLLIGGHELVISEAKKDRLMNIVKPKYPMPPYHFIVYTEYETLENPGVKLGVALETAAEGLKVVQVLPESAAHTHGIKTGDTLLKLNGLTLAETFDLTYELNQLSEGDSIVLTLNRDNEQLDVPITFKSPPSNHPDTVGTNATETKATDTQATETANEPGK